MERALPWVHQRTKSEAARSYEARPVETVMSISSSPAGSPNPGFGGGGGSRQQHRSLPLKMRRRGTWSTWLLVALIVIFTGLLVFKVIWIRVMAGPWQPVLDVQMLPNGTSVLDLHDGNTRQVRWENHTDVNIDCAVLMPEAGKPHLATFIYAPGLAQSVVNNPLPGELCEEWPTIKWVTMQEPLKSVPVRKTYMNEDLSRAWFSMRTNPFDITTDRDDSGMLQSARQISGVIRTEQRSLVRSLRQARGQSTDTIEYTQEEMQEAARRIVLGGFSQGGVMTLLTGLTFPDQLGGLMAFSPFLPMRAALPGMMAPLNRQDIPIFMAHGNSDPYLLYKDAEKSRDIMKDSKNGLGLRDVEFRTMKGLGHGQSIAEIKLANEWMRRKVFRGEPKVW